ncbi:MAG: adenylate kinase [Candidatus Acetothermia bacterium]|nr:adenylate kinase [Candidatus Acetothermia bacterium]
MRNVVLLGPPGAGKGTLAARLSQELGLLHLSTGDVLRDEVARGTELGRLAQGYMSRGELVPDEVILAMVRERVDGRRGVLFDGFPRTLAQAKGLAAFAPVDVVVFLAIAKDEVVRRLSSRRVCASCGAVYNLITQPPQVAGRCDRCGGDLVQRPDDRPDVIARRFEVYERDSAPLVDHYARQGLLVRVDAGRPPEAVFADVLAKIQG